MLFECHGIVCKHIIKVFDMHKINKVLEMYILRRWLKDVLMKHSRVNVAYHDLSKTKEVKRFYRLMVASEPLFLKACAVEDCFSMVLDSMKLLDIRMNEKLRMDEGISGVATSVRKTPAKNKEKSSPKSVNKRKGSSPPTEEETCGVGSPTVVLVNDPVSRKKPHRTTSCRHRSRVEKLKRKPMLRANPRQQVHPRNKLLNNLSRDFPMTFLICLLDQLRCCVKMALLATLLALPW